MNITNREKEVLNLISSGHTIKQIAHKLYISPHTAISHKKSLFEKLKVQNTPHLVSAGFRHGILQIFIIAFTTITVFSQIPLDIQGDAIIEGKINSEFNTGNVSIGKFNAINANSDAFYNTIMGYDAGKNIIDGDANIILGYSAGLTSNGNANVYIGASAGRLNISGFKNTFVGDAAGVDAAGSNLTLIGAESGTLNQAVRSVALGFGAQVGCSNCAVIGGTGFNAVDVGIGLSNPHTPLHIKNKLDGAFNPEAITLEDLDDSETWELNTFSDLLAFDRNGVNKAYIDPNDGSYNATSDIRLKKNIKPLVSVLDRIKKIGAYRYQFKEQNNSQFTIGVIAQEVQNIFPELVKNTGKHLSVNYDSFGPIAIQAIKEQQQIIEELKQSNEALTARLSAIENLISGIAQNQE